MTINLQLFSEDAIKNQTANALRKGIRSLKKVVEIHKAKIANPTLFYPGWNAQPELKRQGDIKHWLKEIKNAEESIRNREEELRKRGEKF